MLLSHFVGLAVCCPRCSLWAGIDYTHCSLFPCFQTTVHFHYFANTVNVLFFYNGMSSAVNVAALHTYTVTFWNSYLRTACKLMAHLDLPFGQRSEFFFRYLNFYGLCYDGSGASIRVMWVEYNFASFHTSVPGIIKAATYGQAPHKVKVMLRQTISQSVSQYVVVSDSLWNPWPDVLFCLKVAVLSLWGALSDERSGLSPVSHFHQCLVHCQWFNIIYIVHVLSVSKIY
jgi:hypothetical protein